MKLKLSSLLLLVFASTVQAADRLPDTPTTPMGAIERSDIKRAATLLDQASDYFNKNGPEQSFVAFNQNKGPFVNHEFYVFVVGLDGVLYASGGASAVMVGTNVHDLHDAAGKPFINDMLEAAKTRDSGSVQYHWLNNYDHRVEIKTTEFRKIGSYLVCVGYYIPRATREEAKIMLDRAVVLLKKSGGSAAFAAFNNPKGGYVIKDEYVVAVGLNDGKYRANGDRPDLTGSDVRTLTDAAGKPFIQDMISLAKQKGHGTVDYVWRNPATNGVEMKHTLVQRVDKVLLGVGYYTDK